jgi:hypothetical protein
MRRLSVLELHERAWFPQRLRNLVTDALQVVLNAGRVYRPIAARLRDAVGIARAEWLVDLCSGGAGPWLWLHSVVGARNARPFQIILTDKYPNLAAFEHARRISRGAITYSAEPVDAACIPDRLSGFRTIFSSFHHFPPPEAVAILQNAADHRQGIGIFEAARRRPSTIMATAVVPLAALVTAPFIRPFQLSRLFWTYLLPVIPLVLFVDGILSSLRAYSPAELMELCARVSAPGYAWEAGEAPGRFGPVTYLLGYPRGPSSPQSTPVRTAPPASS